jgi:pantoate--beta-alanine ligase
MELLTTAEACRAFRSKHSGLKLALVPTMGNLHAGHVSLMHLAGQQADLVMVSLFVNPTQFGPNEDFERYPRTPEQDLAACQTAGVAAVFMPEASVLYPESVSSQEVKREGFTVTPPSYLTQQLCGLSRAGHFEGVCQVVLKLFNVTQPDVAVFGQKDAQQLAVLKAMVADLLLPITLVAAPISREADGLARSSRNAYLSPEARKAAPLLYQTIKGIKAYVLEQTALDSNRFISAEEALEAVWPTIPKKCLVSPWQWQYLSAVRISDFTPSQHLVPNETLLVAAVLLDGVRLLDNLSL